MSLTALRAEIAYEMAARFRVLRPEAPVDDAHPGRLRCARDNLAPGVDYETLRTDLFEIGARSAAGGMTRLDGLVEIDSSVALAVNTFGPFRASPELLELPALSGFSVLRFGKRLRLPFGVAPVDLDVLALGGRAILGAGFSLSESLAPRTASAVAGCSRAVAEVASPEWAEMYESICRHPTRFRLFDASRFVRLYLGMRCALADEPQPKTLLHVFWEPVDWSAVPAFAQHRREVLEFSLAVAGSDPAFVSISCAELWNAMEEGPPWTGRGEWLAYLRGRYLF
jgi:hypothetical protein